MPKLEPQVIQRMKELWEIGRLSGAKLNGKIAQEFALGKLEWTQGLPDDTALPIHRTTPYAMAKRYGWYTPETKSAKAKPAQSKPVEEEDEPISGITDPIWHLSCILAEQKAHQYTHDPSIDGIPNPFRSADVEQIVFAILMDVDKAYRPKPKMFRELEPKLIELVAGEQKKYQAMLETANEPAAGRGSEEILAEFLAQGYEIDDGHAGLDIVYTNPEEPEVNED